MIRFTELVYLAAPYALPEERRFNLRLAKLIRSYNFPLLMPQESVETLSEHQCLPDWQPRPELLQGEVDLDQLMAESCMDALNRANLLIAVFYGEEFDPVTAFEVGYALGRRTNVVAIQNSLEPKLYRSGSLSRLATPHSCSRVIIVPQEDDHFTDRLIPVLNRYFVPHKL